MEHQTHQWAHMSQSDDFFELNKSQQSAPVQNIPNVQNMIVPAPPAQQSYQQPSVDQEALRQLKLGFEQMMRTMERLESRISKIEQTTNSILKNQQEVLNTPFMSQNELDHARKVAEQLEQDTAVAKQLQAAYNKETEVRRTVASYSNTIGQCPICQARVSGLELESHVDKCLVAHSNDPKKEKEVKETKAKVEQGFFSRLYKTTESKKTKVISTMPPGQNTPLMADQEGSVMATHQPYYPGYPTPVYPPYMAPGSPHAQHQMMMPPHMPMYMYPSYPGMNTSQKDY